MPFDPGDEDPIAYEVKESFATSFNGHPVTYKGGEPVHPDDPLVEKYPQYFRPIRFVHDHKAYETPAGQEADSANEEQEPGDTVETLTEGNTRDQLVAIARDAGVVDPELMPNKPTIAQAILDAQAQE